MKKELYVDIDGTICTLHKSFDIKDYTKGVNVPRADTGQIAAFDLEDLLNIYKDIKPYYDRIEHINSLYDDGKHNITYWTARGYRHTQLMKRAGSGSTDHIAEKAAFYELTEKQLKEWGCKYHELQVATKPVWDLYICDKSIHSDDYFSKVLNG